MSDQEYNNISVMADFTELLKHNPKGAYDFICRNDINFSKEGLIDIVKELLYSVKYHTDTRFYGNLYCTIMEDVGIELDEKYEEAYEEV